MVVVVVVVVVVVRFGPKERERKKERVFFSVCSLSLFSLFGVRHEELKRKTQKRLSYF